MSLYSEQYSLIRKFLIEHTNSGIFANMKLPPNNESSHIFESGCYMFNDYEDYISNFVKAYDSGKYLVLLTDGSFFQFNFETIGKGKKEKFKRLTIAYCPHVDDGKWKNDYIRFDYVNEDGSFFHNDAHLHIGLDSSMRFPVDKILDFKEFCSLVFYLYYEEYFLLIFNNGKKLKSNYAGNIYLNDKLHNFLYLTAIKLDFEKIKDR